MKIGVGTDIVPVARVAALIDGGSSRFLERWFTSNEIDYCQSKAHPEQHFAARLAAKEAVFKALGLDSRTTVPWLEIAIVATSGSSPDVELSGDLEQHAVRRGVDDVRVSLSHCADYATATAVSTFRS